MISLPISRVVIAIALLAGFSKAFADTKGLTFIEGSKCYDMRSAPVDAAEDFSIEAWVSVDANCPEGACIIDKRGSGSQLGYRLEVGPKKSLRFVVSGLDALQSLTSVASDRPTQAIFVFSPRRMIARLYIDEKLVASAPSTDRRFESARSEVPLRVGRDQNGNHPFVGSVSRLAVFDVTLTDAQVAQRFTAWDSIPGLLAAWDFSRPLDENIQSTVGNVVLKPPLVITPAGDGPRGKMTLWYGQPAREWVEAIPTGNGRLGAMVYGGVPQEQLQLNEDTIWSGGPYDPANPGAPAAFAKSRELIFAGKQKEADELLKSSAMGTPFRQAAYQTLGNLVLDFRQNEGSVTNYRRSLDLDTAIATTSYNVGGINYTRQVFCSAPDRVIVVRLTADKPASVSFLASMNSPHKSAHSEIKDNSLVMSGRGEKHEQQEGEVKFVAILGAMNQGGIVTAESNSLKIEKADAVTLLLSCGTNFINWHNVSGDAEGLSVHDLKASRMHSFEELRDRHLADYQPLFHRVAFDLGTAPSGLTTEERIKHFSQGDDPQLAALFFQFGRYLLISCSRPGGQAANLQGLWNQSLSAPWDGKYTININTEENYWPAETTNLSECASPLFQLVRDIAQSGSSTAKVMYNARGWVCHHNTDIWRATAPIDWPSVGMWPTGGAWLCTHLWEHYQFTGDRKFLAEVYPILKGSCQFFLDTLVEEPAHHWMVTCPSISPEHGGVVAGPSMDMQILRDLFSQTASASEILGIDPDFRKQILATRQRLAPPQIGRYGQLQEWMQDLDKEKDPYRHLSHLYAVFPSNQIGPATPVLFAAAKKSLMGRGDGATGWSLAWKINLWARMHDGDHAYLLLTHLLSNPRIGPGGGGGTYPNLFDAHPPFQIDGNFAATSGMTEMLLQSQEGFIRLLPGLPGAWPNGEVDGLCARGGFTIGISWRKGHLTQASILSRLGNPCRIYSAQPIAVRSGNSDIQLGEDAGNIYTFSTSPNGKFQIQPTVNPAVSDPINQHQ